MKRDQQRVRTVLADTVTLLCRNGLTFQRELRIQGVIGITIDESDTFIVHINETFDGLLEENSLSPDGRTTVREVTRSNLERKKDLENISCRPTHNGSEINASHESVDDSINSSSISYKKSSESYKRDRSDSECVQQRPIKIARRSSFSTIGHIGGHADGSVSLDGFTTDPDHSVELRKSTSESGRTDGKRNINLQDSKRNVSVQASKRNKIVLSAKKPSVSADDSCTISSEEDIDEEQRDNGTVRDKVENVRKLGLDGSRTINKLPADNVGIKPEETSAAVTAPRSPRYRNNTAASIKLKVFNPTPAALPINCDVDDDSEKTEKEFSRSDKNRPPPVLNYSRAELPRVKTERSEYLSDSNDLIIRDANDDQSMDRSMEDRGDYTYEEGKIHVDEDDWDDNDGVRKMEHGWIEGENYPYMDQSESDVQNWIGSSNRSSYFGISNSMQSKQLHAANSQIANSTDTSWRRHSWGQSSAAMAADPKYFSSSRLPGEGGGPGYEIMSRFVCSYVGCGTSFSNKQNLQRHQTHKHGREKTYRNRALYF